MSSKTNFKINSVERLPNSEAQITGEILLPFLVELRPKAVEHLSKHLNLPGFRKGKIPEDVLVKQVGEMRVLEEVAELAIAEEYENIIKEALGRGRTGEAELLPITRPDVAITKLASGIPLEFKIKVVLQPEFDLPEYKAIASKVNKKDGDKVGKELLVTDKEVQDVLKELEGRNIKPELEEGEQLADKVRENLVKEKEYRAKEKRRLGILEKLVGETKIEVPEVMVKEELAKMTSQFKDDVSRAMGLDASKDDKAWKQYLEQIKKTEEDLHTDWRDKAVDRVKAELIIGKIAEVEKLEPKKEDIEHEAKHLIEHYPDADPFRAHLYVYTQLRNQMVLEFLEGQG